MTMTDKKKNWKKWLLNDQLHKPKAESHDRYTKEKLYQIAKDNDMSRSNARRCIYILKYAPEEVKQALREGKISTWKGYKLTKLYNLNMVMDEIEKKKDEK